MKKKWCSWWLCLIGLLMVCGCETAKETQGQNTETRKQEKNQKEQILVGDVPIDAYTICYTDDTALEAAKLLRDYIARTGGGQLACVKIEETEKTQDNGQKQILVETEEQVASKLGKIRIENGQIHIQANKAEQLQRAVALFTDTYLGWIKTGTGEEHISNKEKVLHLPWNVEEKQPWIAEREPIVTLWNINWSRGAYMDPAVSVKNNVMYFSEDQLYEYVKMMKYCGFSGIQVTDMCAAWAGLGSYEAVHEKLRIMAEAAHSLDMKFTLWVWGAEFSDCGWVDPDVVYYGDPGKYAFEEPRVVDCFEKYYNIYAEMADCCDRVIGHYYDPGNLMRAEEIAYFAKLLRDKFRAINPEVDFGISCWVDQYDKNIYISELGSDITLYERGYRDEPEKEYTKFRNEIAGFDCRMGTWAWNTCEMEIDQLAQMNFNMDFIRSVYQTARQYDEIRKPSYWSEMDSYHVLNVFSLYCAGQLLIDPDTETEALFSGISEAAVGKEYAEAFAEMLDIIQDARTGDRYDTYFWSREDYVLKSDEYPAQEILNRCNHVIPILQEMIDKGLESYTLPLPLSLKEVLQMMQPHLEQIRSYAAFRIELADLWVQYEQGTEVEQIEERLKEISKPIPNYNCIIGAWGQIEARAQYELVTDFCAKTGMTVPLDATFRENRKLHIYMQSISYQLGKKEPYCIYDPYYQLGLAYGPEETNQLIEELILEGLFQRMEDGGVCLTDWEHYIYHFS